MGIFVGYFSFSGRQQQSECNQCINAMGKIAYKIVDDGATQYSEYCRIYLTVYLDDIDPYDTSFYDLIPDECSGLYGDDVYGDVCKVGDFLKKKCLTVEQGITA